MTSDDDTELVHGSGNLFRDLGRPNPEGRQLKVILAGQVLKVLEMLEGLGQEVKVSVDVHPRRPPTATLQPSLF
jgi:hypothetical protein